MTRIDILYESHSGARLQILRGRVLRACAEVGIEPHWHEWNINHDNLPDSLAVYGTTMVLVDGVDVMSVGNTLFERLYRFIDFFDGGASAIPSGNKISQVLTYAGQNPARLKHSHQLLNFTLLPLFVVSFYFEYLCPICGSTARGLSTGVSDLKSFMGLLLPSMLFSLMIAASGFLYRASERHGYKPFVYGFVGLIFIIVGRFFIHNDAVYVFGMGVMLLASYWNTKSNVSSPLRDCPRCVSANSLSLLEEGEENPGKVMLQ